MVREFVLTMLAVVAVPLVLLLGALVVGLHDRRR
jgi:hypothetical protein